MIVTKQKTKFKTLDEFKAEFFPEGFKKELVLRETGKIDLTLPETLLDKIGKEISKT
jgi:hypothetical protein